MLVAMASADSPERTGDAVGVAQQRRGDVLLAVSDGDVGAVDGQQMGQLGASAGALTVPVLEQRVPGVHAAGEEQADGVAVHLRDPFTARAHLHPAPPA